MQITDVQAFLLSCPMPEPVELPFYGGRRTIFKRDALFVRIATEEGLAGFGPGPAAEAAAAKINGEMREALIGKDPRSIDSLRTMLLADEDRVSAISFGAIEIALYDLWGKAEGCPVYELLGGKQASRLRLYGSAGMYQSPEDYAREAVAVAELGFGAYKYRPALGPEDDLRTVGLIRDRLGPNVGICVDAHAWWRMGDRSYSRDTVERLAKSFAQYDITWLEEPLPPEDREAYADLRKQEIVPIAAGEHETSVGGFESLIKRHAVDIVQADVPHQGGFSSVKAVLELCREHGRVFAFHNWGTELEAIANAQLGVCYTEEVCAWLEYPCYRHRGQDIMYPFPLADEILKEPLTIDNGELVIPDGPGLGVEVDLSVVERYPYLPGPWTVFRIDSPPQEMALSGDHALQWDAG